MLFPNNDNLNLQQIPSTDEIFNLLLAAIAAEQLSLADLIEAEANKINSVLGILPGQTVKNPSIDELERIDKAVERVLKTIIKKEIILEFQLEDILDFLSTSSTTTTTTTASTTTTTTASTTTTTTASTTTTTTASTTTTTASTTTTTTASTTTTTTVSSTSTTTTVSRTSTTTTTTATTTSTTSTSTTTTKRPCTGLCGVLGAATIIQGNSIFSLIANVCSNCGFIEDSVISFSEVALQAQNSINIVGIPSSFEIICDTDSIVISGDANITDTDGTGTGTFVLEIRDNQPNGNDAFQIKAIRNSPFRDYSSPVLNVANTSFVLNQCNG